MKNLKDFGKNLVKLRKLRGMTQQDIKAKSKLYPKQIVKLEKGKGNYNMLTLLAYLEAVGGKLIIK